MTRAYIHHRGDRYQIEVWRRMSTMETVTLQEALALAINADSVMVDGEYMSRKMQDEFRLLGAEEVKQSYATEENK